MARRPDKRASNIQLTPAEVEYYRKRFLAKPSYITPDCIPMRPRQAAEIEVKYGIRARETVAESGDNLPVMRLGP